MTNGLSVHLVVSLIVLIEISLNDKRFVCLVLNVVMSSYALHKYMLCL